MFYSMLFFLAWFLCSSKGKVFFASGFSQDFSCSFIFWNLSMLCLSVGIFDIYSVSCSLCLLSLVWCLPIIRGILCHNFFHSLLFLFLSLIFLDVAFCNCLTVLDYSALVFLFPFKSHNYFNFYWSLVDLQSNIRFRYTSNSTLL